MTRRIAGSIIGVVVVTLVLTGIGTFVMARLDTTGEDLSRLRRTAAETNRLFLAVDESLIRERPAASQPGRPAADDNIRRQLVGALSVSGVGSGYLSTDGQFIGELPDGVRVSDLEPDALGDGDTLGGRRGDTLWAAAAATETLPSGREVVLVTVLTKVREPLLGPTFKWFALSATVAIVVGAVASVVLGRRLGRPVRAAVDATKRVARGDLSAQLTPPPSTDHDELAELARAVNAMATDLRRAKNQERNFLMSVSHDLRTPLTSIRGYAEALADDALEDPHRGALVILEESRRLERMVGDLLDLARIDADRFDLVVAPADVVAIVAGTVEGFAPELNETGLVLQHSLDSTGPIFAVVDVDRLAQVVANLAANAIAFARTTVSVRVREGTEGNDVWIEVGDDGDGIPAAALERVFDRFYQADNQTVRRQPGTGLGLAIVAELTARMGGRVDVTSEMGAGTWFTVRLPAVHQFPLRSGRPTRRG